MESPLMEYYSYLEEQENRIFHSDEMSRLNAMNLKLREMLLGRHSTQREQEDEEEEEMFILDQQQAKKLQVDVLELRRVNKELQQQKRHLNIQLAAALAQLEALESKKQQVEAEAASLRPANEELSKQVESLQNNRFSEVEELVYLRWVNACLRYELRNPEGDGKAVELNKNVSPKSQDKAKRLMLEYAGPELLPLTSSKRFDSSISHHDDCTTTSSDERSGELSTEENLARRHGKIKASLLKKFKGTWARSSSSNRKRLEVQNCNQANVDNVKAMNSVSSIAESFQIMSRTVRSGEVADRYPSFKDRHRLTPSSPADIADENMTTEQDVKRVAARKAKAPPRSSSSSSARQCGKVAVTVSGCTSKTPPPPPPPLPLSAAAGGSKLKASKVRRAPQVIELYQSMMKRDNHSKNETTALVAASCDLADARNSMIGEIENRSSHLLAIKADVQNQGEFVESLAAEIRAAEYTNMEDVVAFVNWLDEELSFLVDERAVLKHFIWPEAKADALRESSFEYQKLKKLEQELAFFADDFGMKRDAALKRMQALLERIEQSIYGFLRTRDAAAGRYKEFKIPTNWMLDSSLIAKVKQSSVKLAEQFMKRVVSELHKADKDKELLQEFLVLQGVRFAFRVHQFAGGFDEESMRAFEELRSHACQKNNTKAI